MKEVLSGKVAIMIPEDITILLPRSPGDMAASCISFVSRAFTRFGLLKARAVSCCPGEVVAFWISQTCFATIFFFRVLSAGNVLPVKAAVFIPDDIAVLFPRSNGINKTALRIQQSSSFISRPIPLLQKTQVLVGFVTDEPSEMIAFRIFGAQLAAIVPVGVWNGI